MTLDPSPSFVDLLLWDLLSRHEVVFPFHQHLYHLVLERVVFFLRGEEMDSHRITKSGKVEGTQSIRHS